MMLVRLLSLALSLVTAAAPIQANTTANIEAPKYTGKRIDYVAYDVDIIEFLNDMGAVEQRNIVADEGVSGKVTVRVQNAPWDEVLDVVLKSKEWGREEIGSIIRVAPLEVLQEESRRPGCPQSPSSEPRLKARIIPVNYSEASTFEPVVSGLLTLDAGSVTIDSRTNVLIVKDLIEVIQQVEVLVRRLDQPPPAHLRPVDSSP